LEIFLDGKLGQQSATAAVFRLDIWQEGDEMGVSVGWKILAHGLRALCICLWLYPLSPVPVFFFNCLTLEDGTERLS
jgi:hypothetical protein